MLWQRDTDQMRTGKLPQGASVSLSVHYKRGLKISEESEIQDLIKSKAVKYLLRENKMTLGYLCSTPE